MDAKRLEKLEARLTEAKGPLGEWRQRRAVAALARDASPRAVWLLANAYSHSDVHVQCLLAETLRELASHHHDEAGEALCFLVIQHDCRQAREAVLALQLAPRDPHRRALFFFLTGQWDRYESLDFDHSLLQSAYETAPVELRQRLAAQAWHSGRVEWVHAAAGGRQGRRLGEMTDREWWAALATLAKRGQRAELWQLALEAPAVWSARILSRLRDLPAAAGSNAPDATLMALAAHCEGEIPDAPGGVLRCRTQLTGPAGLVTGVAFSSDQQTLTAGSFDGKVCLWRLPEDEPFKTLEQHAAPVTSLAVCPGGWVLASGSLDHSVCLWSFPGGRLLKQLQGHTDAVLSLAMRADGRVLASGSADQSVRLWNMPNGWLLKNLEIRDGAVLSVALTADGSILAAGTDARHIHLVSLRDTQERRELRGHWGDIRALAVSPDDSILASAGGDKRVFLWRLSEGEAITTLDGHHADVTALAFSPDGGILASGGMDDTIRLWRIADGQLLHTLEVGCGGVTALAFSRDGRILASGGADRRARLWSSELARLLHLPVRQTTLADLHWVQETLDTGAPSVIEKRWLAFLLALLRWRHRDDIGLESAPVHIDAGAFAIEIEVGS